MLLAWAALTQMQLRDAMIAFLEKWKGQESPVSVPDVRHHYMIEPAFSTVQNECRTEQKA